MLTKDYHCLEAILEAIEKIFEVHLQNELLNLKINLNL